MLMEMHCHTAEHSACSSVPAVELVRRVLARGLQGIVLTDHHYLWQEPELKMLRRNAGVPDHFLIFSAQEVNTRDWGDILVYGADVPIPRGSSLAVIRTDWPQAALVWAHPYRNGRLPDDSQLLCSDLDGVEIFTSNHSIAENSRALFDWHRLRFVAIAGTDTHGSQYAGTYPTIFDHPVRHIHELAAELRLGRCRPFFKEIPHSGANSQVTEVTIGTKGETETRERIIIRTITSPRKWKSAERAASIITALAGSGFCDKRFRVPLSIGVDAEHMTLIEQGVRGKSLFDKIVAASPADGRTYLELAARWLGRLHAARLAVTPPGEFAKHELERLEHYVSRFTAIDHRHTKRAQGIRDAVIEAEQRLFATTSGLGLVQGHGDFHPKNVIIGQDNQENRETLFAAAIDFESSLMLPPAFDVGTFLAQFRNQFFAFPEILARLPEEAFLDAYTVEAGPLSAEFVGQVDIFRARTNLSIASYLIKVGMGESEDLWRVLVEAERALLQFQQLSSV
jgi:3',5'-nucleoside bisphosphate phosphatase